MESSPKERIERWGASDKFLKSFGEDMPPIIAYFGRFQPKNTQIQTIPTSSNFQPIQPIPI